MLELRLQVKNMSNVERKARAAARSAHSDLHPIRSYRLGAEPAVDLRVATTIEERLREMFRLSREMYLLTGRPFPTYSRAEMPGRVIRRRIDDAAGV